MGTFFAAEDREEHTDELESENNIVVKGHGDGDAGVEYVEDEAGQFDLAVVEEEVVPLELQLHEGVQAVEHDDDDADRIWVSIQVRRVFK